MSHACKSSSTRPPGRASTRRWRCSPTTSRTSSPQEPPRRAPVSDDIVRIEAPARLHFGMLDLRGSLGRRFGGIGAGIFSPSLQLEAKRAESLECEGPDADRAAAFAQRYFASQGLREAVRIRIHRGIPSHAGLGSGTQLALAVARAIAELYDLPREISALAVAMGRARRSAIGTWLFDGGGFVVEGGRTEHRDRIAPLLARISI